MKSQLAAAFLALATVAFAGDEGSFAPVTSMLTLTDFTVSPATVLTNGNKQYTATETVFKVTTAAILAECQRQNILTVGNVSGWRLFAVFNGNGTLVGFVINNGLDTIPIKSVIGIRRSVLNGFSTKGKWQENTAGTTISGSTTYLSGYILDVTIDGITYTSTVVSKITDKVVTFGVLSDPVWRPAAYKITVAGISSDEAGDGRLLQGSLSIAAAKANWNLGLSLLGFPGFADTPEETE